ncbi:hypothetical protein GCM10027598_71640 [Amycolatopsis oliviviridis]|uniref:Uncharacterized protein n=1 Tax=Amycolatopsis oliviviridis TaxID=1471590 RepID=A0ABQ3L3W5_9PSEU|nr:hypothetical protein GCM10017790_01580 [Amycolatopsis oliviviridis]
MTYLGAILRGESFCNMYAMRNINYQSLFAVPDHGTISVTNIENNGLKFARAHYLNHSSGRAGDL